MAGQGSSRIKALPGAFPGAIIELLRWETPVPNLPRISADRSIEFLGKELPPQSFVLFSMAAANRDPAVFDNPDLYDIERPAKDTLTFGRGERSCPGMHLARKSLAAGPRCLGRAFSQSKTERCCRGIGTDRRYRSRAGSIDGDVALD